MPEPLSLWPHTGAILMSSYDAQTSASKAETRMWDDRTMLETVLRTMLSICRSVVIVGESSSSTAVKQERVRHLPNPRAELGPLAGLEALLGSNLDTQYLVATCDQPFLAIPLLWQLTEGDPSAAHMFLIPKGTSFHPFPCYFPSSLLGAVQQTLTSKTPTMRRFVKQHPPLWVPLSESEANHLLQVNAPEQLARLQRLAGHNTISF